MSTFNNVYQRRNKITVMEIDKTRKIEEAVVLTLAPITPAKVYQRRQSNASTRCLSRVSAEEPQDSASLVDIDVGVLTQELILDSAAAGHVSFTKRISAGESPNEISEPNFTAMDCSGLVDIDVDVCGSGLTEVVSPVNSDGLIEIDVGLDTSLNSTGSLDINVGPDSTFSLETSLNSSLTEAALPPKQEEAVEFADIVAHGSRISAKRVLSWGDTSGSDFSRPLDSGTSHAKTEDRVELKPSPTSQVSAGDSNPSSTEKLSNHDFEPLTPSPKRKRPNGGDIDLNKRQRKLPKRKKHRPKIFIEGKPKKVRKEKPIKKPRVASQKPKPPKSTKGRKNRECSAGGDQQMADHVTEEVSQVTNGNNIEKGDAGSQKIERNITKSRSQSKSDTRALTLLLGGGLGARLTMKWCNYGTRSRGEYCWRPDETNRIGCHYNSFYGYQRNWKVNSCLTSIRRVGFNVPKSKRFKRKKRRDVLSLSLVRFPDISVGSAGSNSVEHKADHQPEHKAAHQPEHKADHFEHTDQQKAHADQVAAKAQQSELKGRRKVKAQQADEKGTLKLKSKSTGGRNKAEIEPDDVKLKAKELNLLVSRFKKLNFNPKKGKNKKKLTEKGAIVPYKHPLKVFLDEVSMRMWNQLMKIEQPEEMSNDEKEKEREKWGKERMIFGERIDFFTKIVRQLLGDRRFKAWKGSVVDSIVGVFLTQNVSDHLSSSAYLSLSAKFPLEKLPEDEEDEEIVNSQESVASNPEYDIKGNKYYVVEPEQDTSLDEFESSLVDTRESPVVTKPAYIHSRSEFELEKPMSQESQSHDRSEPSKSEVVKDLQLNKESSEKTPLSQESEKDLHSNKLNKQLQSNEPMSQESQSHERSEPSKSEVVKDLQSNKESFEKTPLSQESDQSHERSEPSKSEVVKDLQSNKESGCSLGNASATTQKPKGKKKVPLEKRDWDELRRVYSRPIPKSETDSVDWEKVRHADPRKIADTIIKRGQHVILGGRIKDFLNRTVEMHKSIDLEWLRHAPPEDVKQYLLEIPGLGLKSVECVRLLSLRHTAFPVDTNVGRIAVRLGWVPLEPLPGDVQFHLLQEYPMMDSIQKYLWPRLCGLEQQTLYELHYQMITFGKVFCTKRNPNCGPCPLKGNCLYYASKDRARQASLPAPHKNAKGEVRSEIPSILDTNDANAVQPMVIRSNNESSQVRSRTTLNCEPIIEEPKTPVHEQDIEDFCMEDTCYDEEEEITIFRLSNGSLNDATDTCSKELVPSQAENSSRPAPKLRNEERMRTEYQVYELPDTHEILRNFNKIESGSLPYLLAVWAPGEVPNSCKKPEKTEGSEGCNDEGCSNSEGIGEQNEETVLGTVMIPCRTATRQRFPLNGTYFQVNEVFADHESSYQPIKVRRATLWNLPTQTLYFGTSTTSIYRDLEIEKISESFWQGYVCVRAIDRKTGFPKPLSRRFHIPRSERKENKKETTGKGTKSKKPAAGGQKHVARSATNSKLTS